MSHCIFGLYETPLACFKIAQCNGAITYLKKVAPSRDRGEQTALGKDVYKQLLAYLAGELKHFDFPYQLHGTPFEQSVWNALTFIPYGETRCYEDIAIQIGRPKAARAIGMANNKNPITIAIPCHRVIGKNGSLVGYAGGLDMKKALLSLEKKT